jgi:spermidine synthase
MTLSLMVPSTESESVQPASQELRLLSPVLLVSVVIIATSGLVYELIAGTVASYVLGDSVAQFSFVIGFYLFAMGVGSYLSRFVVGRLLERFVEIELAVALVGGISAPLLFAVYTSRGAFRPTLYGIVLIVGTLVGLEIPLLIRLLESRVKLKDLVARVLALDYVGALLASLLFPLVMLPRLGIQRTSLVFGILNALVAVAATFLIPIRRRTVLRLRLQAALIVVALGLSLAFIDRAVLKGEASYFGAPIIYARQSSYQRLVLTKSTRSTRLYLNGNLQFSSEDEHRYHETLVHPAVAALGRAPKQAMILGGGDGLAARELLRYPDIQTITLVDLDPAVTDVFRQVDEAVRLNEGALNHSKVRVVNQDAFSYLRQHDTPQDLVIIDFPDPSNYALGKLYSLSFYRLLRQRLRPHGVAVVQTTSPYYARKAFWTIARTMRAADFRVHPMHVHVPSFGEWGFVMLGGPRLESPRRLLLPASRLRYLDESSLAQLFTFPKDMQRVPAPINRLNDQPLVGIYTREWGKWSP